MKDIKRILAESKPLHKALFGLLFLSVFSTLVGLITPWIYREIVNFLTEKELSPFFGQFITTDNVIGILIALAILFLIFDVLAAELMKKSGYYRRLFKMQGEMLEE
jgi:ABC-type multidrug transport system fused ATPase/permease subunit